MSKIKVADLIAWFQRMYQEHWKYTWGHAQDGDVDCSGAFAYAYRKLGHTIPHGSNTIARSYVKELQPISKAKTGMAAFKIRKPGDKYYDLPAKFQKGGSSYNGDLNDYYHIGLVDEDGKHVLNAQSEKAGFTRTKLSTWGAVSMLNAVEYTPDQTDTSEKEVTHMNFAYQMKVTSGNGKSVNMRKAPDTGAQLIMRLPVGTLVTASEDQNGWREVIHGDEGGWIMSQFLIPVQSTQGATGTDLQGISEPQSENVSGFTKTLTTEQYSRLCDVRDHMESDLAFLKTIVGVG